MKQQKIEKNTQPTSYCLHIFENEKLIKRLMEFFSSVLDNKICFKALIKSDFKKFFQINM